MKKVFTFKDQEFRVIHRRVHNYKILDELDNILVIMAKSAEYHDISEKEKDLLFQEKMQTKHE